MSETLLDDLRSTAKERFLPILRPATAQILQQTLRKERPKQILEVGTAIGYSAILMLREVPDACIETIEIDPERAAEAAENFEKAGVCAQIKLHRGDANDILPNLEGPFDFVLLDGPKGKYKDYIDALDRLLRPGGSIFADNVLYMGLVENGLYPPHKHRTIVMNLRAYLGRVKTMYETQIIDIEEGIALSKKR